MMHCEKMDRLSFCRLEMKAGSFLIEIHKQWTCGMGRNVFFGEREALVVVLDNGRGFFVEGRFLPGFFGWCESDDGVFNNGGGLVGLQSGGAGGGIETSMVEGQEL